MEEIKTTFLDEAVVIATAACQSAVVKVVPLEDACLPNGEPLCCFVITGKNVKKIREQFQDGQPFPGYLPAVHTKLRHRLLAEIQAVKSGKGGERVVRVSEVAAGVMGGNKK